MCDNYANAISFQEQSSIVHSMMVYNNNFIHSYTYSFYISEM